MRGNCCAGSGSTRRDRPPQDLEGRAVILVNDGLATGASVRAAVQTFAPAPPGTGRPGAPIGAGIDLPGMSVEADDIVCATRRRRSRPAAHRIETAPSRA